jgi:hypothetical protein
MSQSWSVSIEERGREGTVCYREGARSIPCYWEFCGGEAIAAVSIGTVDEWQRGHGWAVERREEIVRRIGSEVLRQRAPSCRYEMDESNGWLTVFPAGSGRGSGSAAPPPVPIPAAFGAAAGGSAEVVQNIMEFRSKFALIAIVAVLLIGALVWIGGALFKTRTIGSPIGDSVRVGNTIATMMHRLVPYVPSLHRDPSKDRYSVGVLLQTADGSSAPRYVELAESLPSTDSLKSRFCGSDPQRIWFIAPELGAIDLASGRVLNATELAAALPSAPKSRGSLAEFASGSRALEWLLTSGGLMSPTRFIASMSEKDARDRFEPNDPARPVTDWVQSRDAALVWLGEVTDREGSARLSPLASQPGPTAYFTSFLRSGRDGPLLVLPPAPGGKASVLRLFEKARWPRGTVFLSRIDESGATLWEADLGVEHLDESLPDPKLPAFIGRLPAAPNKMGEPVLVVVDATSGAVTRHSLLMK